MIIFGYLFFKEMAVQLVAGLTNRQAAAIFVEDFYLLIVKVVATVSQLASSFEVRRFRFGEGLITEPYSRQTTVDHITAQRAQYLVVRMLPVLDGNHDVVVVHLSETVEEVRRRRVER